MSKVFPRWKLWVLLVTLIFGIIYALPNLYGEAPILQIYSNTLENTESLQASIKKILEDAQVPALKYVAENQEISCYFQDTPKQLRAFESLKGPLKNQATVALNLAPLTPRWLGYFSATPMKLGLDLRGGVYFLIDVDVASIITRRIESYKLDLRKALLNHKHRYLKIEKMPESDGIAMFFTSENKALQALTSLKPNFAEFDWHIVEKPDAWVLQAHPRIALIQEVRASTVEQTLHTLRNRINELGVAEALVQRQGQNRIVVELPGVQDTARAKEILGKTATLEFLLQDTEHAPETDGIVPLGSKLYHDRHGRPIYLKKKVILDGSAINGATTGFDPEGRPVVSVQLDSLNANARQFNQITQANVGRALGVVYIETKPVETMHDGVVSQKFERDERVISLAVIQTALSHQFQITGLTINESRDLSLLLRAGALPANVSIVEERVIGPSMGQENIKQGLYSAAAGLVLVLTTMAAYYGRFGMIANLALLMNLCLLIALLSILGATLTLPGIAGIVLTLGMAVDANVLIFERIREEFKLGQSMHNSVVRGFDGALATIVDSNLTTLIIGIILFAVGAGPIKGFAITLSLGILTSLFTAVTGSRAIIHLCYGKRPISKQAIGI